MFLQATQITKCYGHRNILNGVNLVVQPDEVVAIFGPNGSGKTTLVKILATLIKPTTGSLQIGGVDALAEPQRVRQSLGLILHEPLAYLKLSPYENLKFFGRIYGIDDLDGRISEVLADVELTSFTHEPVQIFSRGMMQRFMIAKALIHDAAILLLDEPFAGLDAAAKQIVLKLIEKERTRGKGVLLTTHDTELGYLAGSRYVFLLNGQIERVAVQGEIGLEDLSRRYGSRIQNIGR